MAFNPICLWILAASSQKVRYLANISSYAPGLRATSAQRIMDARCKAPFDNAEELARRAKLEQHEMKLLAAAGALATLSGHRRQQVWDAAALHSPPELLQDAPVDKDFLELQAAPEGEDVL